MPKKYTKKNSLTSNVISLSGIQMASYLFPLILVPFLTRTIGLEKYGLYAFGMSFFALSMVFIDFGFDLYAPIRIPLMEQKKKIEKTIGAIYIIKCSLFLALSSFIVLFIKLDFVDPLLGQILLFFLFPIVGVTLQPTWLFMALEQMRLITLPYVLSRVFYIICVIQFVVKPEDITLVITLFGLAQIISAIIGIMIVFKIGYRMRLPEFNLLMEIVKGSSGYFLSRISGALYSSGGAFTLGLFSSATQVAYYSLAELLFRAGQGIFVPIQQALTPFIARKKDLSTYKKAFILSLVLVFAGLGFGLIFGYEIIKLISGNYLLPVYSILSIFLIALCANVPSSLLGYPLLGALGHSSFINKTVIIGGFLYLMLLIILILINKIGPIQIVTTILFIELFILILRINKARNISMDNPQTI
jgi:polysaccharide transporter, PST family